MNKWTNENADRKISTGPTPDGGIGDLVITVGYDAQGQNLPRTAHHGIVLDHHIIPLILRVPEMRETLHDLRNFLVWWQEHLPTEAQSEANSLIERADKLTTLTREELDADKRGA